MSSCIIKNGSLSADFDLSRREARRSFLIYPISIHNRGRDISCNEIKGIKLESDEYKIVQYADDLIVFLSDIKSVQNLFKLLLTSTVKEVKVL